MENAPGEGSSWSLYGIFTFHLHKNQEASALLFEVFLHHPFVLSPSFCSFQPSSICLLPLGPCLSLTSTCWSLPQIMSREHVTPLVTAMKRRRRVVVRISAAVYRLSNVLLRGRKSSARLIVPVFVCSQMVHNRFIETAAIPLFAIVKMTPLHLIYYLCMPDKLAHWTVTRRSYLSQR